MKSRLNLAHGTVPKMKKAQKKRSW